MRGLLFTCRPIIDTTNVNRNNKKEVFFSNIFKESYKTFLFNRHIVNNKEFDIVIKKNKEFAFLRLIFNNGVFKGVLLIEKWRVK